MIGQLLCVILILTERVTSEGCHFGYEGAIGYDHWGDIEQKCLGKHQSPIEIDSEHVTRTVLPHPLRLNGFDVALPANLTNNGHTAMMTINSCDKKPTISGGPLNEEYEFAQLHFHWGANDTCGSEDKIDNKRFPMELHLVFYNKKYGDVNSAMASNNWDGLCVLGCLFEIQDSDNDNYNSFARTLPQIVKPNSVRQISKPLALFDLIPTVLSSYYTYNGSLTTPPCAEVVTWIEFDNTVKISHDQLEIFRNLVDSEDVPLVNNFRAIQPLGDRVVLYNYEEIEDCSQQGKLRRIISIVADKVLDIYNLLSAAIY